MRIPRPLILASALLPALAPAGCSSGGSDPDSVQVISREAFVQAYVELRIASHRHPSQEILLEERDRILQAHGLTPEDLLTFVEVHGADADLMHEIWEEVDAKFRELRTNQLGPQGGDSVTPPGGSPDRPPTG